ncbi:MAG: beta-eliminating lyase-related protein, partial [Dermatophilaceae bacterium]
AERMTRARVWRKRYGGGMRQVGILAAAGLYALDHHVERLADDHARARRFAVACAEAAPGVVEPAHVETNIVILRVGEVGWEAARFVAALAEHGVRTYPVGAGRVRAVWHLDIDDTATDAAISVATKALRP